MKGEYWSVDTIDVERYKFDIEPTAKELLLMFDSDDNIPQLLEEAERNSDLNKKWQNKFLDLLYQHINVFSHKPKITRLLEHHIVLTDTTPFTAKYRPVSEKYKRIMKTF